jgi:hypothetical protein
MKTSTLVIFLLAGLAIGSSLVNFDKALGIDFLQYWAVCKAQKWSHDKLKSPYVETIQYYEVLTAYVDSSNDLRLKKAHQVNNQLYSYRLNLTPTPLYFLPFALLPEDYSHAFAIFQTVQILLFIASILKLNLAPNGNRLWLGSLVLLLLLAYNPLLSDLHVGNFNCFQLFALVLLTRYADRVLASRSAPVPFGPCIVFMCSIVFLTLLKPNLVLVMLLLAAHLWARHGTKIFGVAALAAAALGAVLVLLPCIQFGSWTVWLDWYRYFKTITAIAEIYSISYGNFASIVLISQALHVNMLSVASVLTAALITSACGALIISSRRGKSGARGVWQTAVLSLRDPYLSAAIGVTATLAVSPMLWPHYYLLSLLPALWLLSPQQRWSHAGIAGGLSILCTVNIAPKVLNSLFGWANLEPIFMASGWVPLWVGLLVVIARYS